MAGRCLQGFLWSMQLWADVCKASCGACKPYFCNYTASAEGRKIGLRRGESERACVKKVEDVHRPQETGYVRGLTSAPSLLDCSTRNPIRVVVDALLPCLHLISIHSTQRLRPYRVWGGRPGRHYVTLFTYPATNSVSSFGECSFRARLWFISMKS